MIMQTVNVSNYKKIIQNKIRALCKKCIKYINDPSYVFYSYHVSDIDDPYTDQLCSGYPDCSDCSKNKKYTKSDWLIVMKKPSDVRTNEDRKDITDTKTAYYEAERLIVSDIINIHDPNISIDYLLTHSQKINPETNHEIAKKGFSYIDHTLYEKGKSVYRFGHTYKLAGQSYHACNTFQIGVGYFKSIVPALTRIISIIGIDMIK